MSSNGVFSLINDHLSIIKPYNFVFIHQFLVFNKREQNHIEISPLVSIDKRVLKSPNDYPDHNIIESLKVKVANNFRHIMNIEPLSLPQQDNRNIISVTTGKSKAIYDVIIFLRFKKAKKVTYHKNIINFPVSTVEVGSALQNVTYLQTSPGHELPTVSVCQSAEKVTLPWCVSHSLLL